MSESPVDTNPSASRLYAIGLPLGGLCLGYGIVNLYYSMGWDGGAMGQDFVGVGYSGIDNLGLLPAADYSFLFVAAGIAILVSLNRVAWRHTGGY